MDVKLFWYTLSTLINRSYTRHVRIWWIASSDLFLENMKQEDSVLDYFTYSVHIDQQMLHVSCQCWQECDELPEAIWFLWLKPAMIALCPPNLSSNHQHGMELGHNPNTASCPNVIPKLSLSCVKPALIAFSPPLITCQPTINMRRNLNMFTIIAIANFKKTIHCLW